MPNSSLPSPVSPACPDSFAQRTMQRMHNRDGVPEICTGLFFLFVAGLGYAQAVLPTRSRGSLAIVVTEAILVPVLCVLFSLPGTWAWIRNWLPVAKVGYAKQKPMSRKRVAVFVGAFCLSAILAVTVLVLAQLGLLPTVPDRWILAGTGIICGALLAFAGGRPRFVVNGTLIAAIGIPFALSQAQLSMGFARLFGFTGVLLLLSGGLVLGRLLSQPAEREE